MKPEILAKILRIIGKTGEKLVILDENSGNSFVIMGLDAYEKVCSVKKQDSLADLTENKGSGIIDPDSALAAEARESSAGEWGGSDSIAEEDRYYMEPAD